MLTAAIVVTVAILCVSVAARMILKNRRGLPAPTKEATRYARPDALP